MSDITRREFIRRSLILSAGEHASYDHGWMQGALFSGLRAAVEINEGN